MFPKTEDAPIDIPEVYVQARKGVSVNYQPATE